MKLLATVETIGLMFLGLATNVVSGLCHNLSIDKPMLTFELIAGSFIHRNSTNTTIAAYRPDAIQSVLETASELFAIQIVGAATSLDQLKLQCEVFSSSSARLQSSGYDTALIQKIICTAAGGIAIPSLDEIVTLIAVLSSEIWIIQAIGAVQSKSGVKKLCDMINVSSAFAIGLQGNLVKEDVCAAAAVVDKVAKSGQPAQVTLIADIDDPLAPVTKIVLPLVPTQAV